LSERTAQALHASAFCSSDHVCSALPNFCTASTEVAHYHGL
jgi:hypothetical protein